MKTTAFYVYVLAFLLPIVCEEEIKYVDCCK